MQALEPELGCEKRVTCSQRVGDSLQEGDSVQQDLAWCQALWDSTGEQNLPPPGELLFLLGEAWLQCGVME